MDFGHRRCTSWILWSLNLDKLQNFILLLVLCRQLLVEEKEGLVGDIAFLQVKMGLLVVVFHVILQCTDMVAFKTGVIFSAVFLPPLRSSLASRLPSLAWKTTNRLFYRHVVYHIPYSYGECCGSLFGFMPSCWFLEIWASRHSYDCYGIFNP